MFVAAALSSQVCKQIFTHYKLSEPQVLCDYAVGSRALGHYLDMTFACATYERTESWAIEFIINLFTPMYQAGSKLVAG
jgi:hypothetical protein